MTGKRNSLDYAITRLDACHFKYDVLGRDSLRVYCKTGGYVGLERCDDPRPGFYLIGGRVENIDEWIQIESYFS